MTESVNSLSEIGQVEKDELEEVLRESLGKLDTLFSQSLEVISAYKSKIAADSKAIDSIKSNTEALTGKSGSIKNIVKSIRDLARQINMLALNASIESARAGQAGAVFSVVAVEIDQLSKKTASAVAEIAEIITEISLELERAGEIMSEIAQQSSLVNIKLENPAEAIGQIAVLAIAAVEENCRQIAGEFDKGRATLEGRKYFTFHRERFLNPLMKGTVKKISGIAAAWFEFSLDNTPFLNSTEPTLGSFFGFNEKSGLIEEMENQVVGDFYPENPYMLWYYGPLNAKKSYWTPLYYDPYLQSEIITFAAPVYQNSKLLGVTGIDFQFDQIRISSYERIRGNLNKFFEK